MLPDAKKYNHKKILIGITGGIGAYKACDMIRYFVKNGAEVRAIMTEHAAEFVTPMTIETLSGNKVITHIFPHKDPWNPSTGGTHHISIAHWPDVFLIAPATANMIGKIAHGIADEVLSTIVMATTAPVLIAPAMNDRMYLNPAVQDNLHLLKQRGYKIIDPGSGFLACGYENVGRLAGLETLAWAVDKTLFGNDLFRNKKILITAGPTQEPLDPVRYLTNRSSGKMGFALARLAAQMGANVTLISGPVSLADPPEARVIRVTTAAEMAEAVFREFSEQDILIMAAAVADFSPKNPAGKKLKKDSVGNEFSLELSRTTDILTCCAERKASQKIVGFALETDDPAGNARKKMEQKNLDAVVINNPNDPGAGFETDTNVISILTRAGLETFPLMTKDEAAAVILGRIAVL